MQPKFVKKLDSPSCLPEFLKWISFFPIITGLYFLIVIVFSILSSQFGQLIIDLKLDHRILVVCQIFTCKSCIQFGFFIGLTAGTLYIEESRGSCRYLITFPIRYALVIISQICSLYFDEQVTQFSTSLTSAPILYCFLIATQQSINLNLSVVDILKLPLQIRTGLYPIILILILEAISYRSDILILYVMGILFDLANIKKLLTWLGKIWHQKCCSCCFKNFVSPTSKPSYHSPTKKQVDHLVTSNSIQLDDQVSS